MKTLAVIPFRSDISKPFHLPVRMRNFFNQYLNYWNKSPMVCIYRLDLMISCFSNGWDIFYWIHLFRYWPRTKILEKCDKRKGWFRSFDRMFFLRQCFRDLLKRLFRFLTSFYSHSNVSSEFFTEKLFTNILTYVQQCHSHTFSKLTLITGAIDVLHQITSK